MSTKMFVLANNVDFWKATTILALIFALSRIHKLFAGLKVYMACQSVHSLFVANILPGS
jgi:hypothetical protein